MIPPNYQILVLKKKAGVDFHQFLVLSAISHSPLKLFKVQSSKAYRKSGAAKAAPATPLPMGMSAVNFCQSLSPVKYPVIKLLMEDKDHHFTEAIKHHRIRKASQGALVPSAISSG